MRTSRSLSQVVLRFLPDQTVDLAGAVWRVDRWVQARTLHVDDEIVRFELIRAIWRFVVSGRDGGLGERLRRNDPIEVLTPNDEEDAGVAVVPFPTNYRCRKCGRIERRDDESCRCGGTSWRQLQFVAYHHCGKVDTPWIPRCREHRQVRVDFPRTTRITDLEFECPECGKLISRGFPFQPCECGDGNVRYHVHKAAGVFTPHSTVVVNPPSRQEAARFSSEAAMRQVLGWAVNGMVESEPLAGRPTVTSLTAELIARGFSEETVRRMVEVAAREEPSTMRVEDPLDRLQLGAQEGRDAADAALRLAYAVAGGRRLIAELGRGMDASARERFEQSYPDAIQRAGLESVELLDDFPVLTAVYGYTRDSGSERSVLRPFPGRGHTIRAYGHLAHTEALLFRLDPLRVAEWLWARKLLARRPDTPVDARIEILNTARIPNPGDAQDRRSPGTEVLTLVHSYAHRVMRRIAAFTGIDRDSLAEYLVPQHLVFIVFAATRGDFVLGGLQALFEHDLHVALDDVVAGEHRCPLDPGCAKHGAACVACLHVGEPACRYFNGFLSRDVLFGRYGYLELSRAR